MTLKDWKKSENEWMYGTKYGTAFINKNYETDRINIYEINIRGKEYVIVQGDNILGVRKTKPQAMKFARNYMRSH